MPFSQVSGESFVVKKSPATISSVTCQDSSGFWLIYPINARPPGRAKLGKTPPPGLTRRENAPQVPGGRDWAQLEFTGRFEKPRVREIGILL